MSTNVTTIGNLAGVPELKFSKDGNAWTRARVLVTDSEKDRETGEWRDTATTGYDVVVFGATAEALVEAAAENGNIRVRFSGPQKIKDVQARNGGSTRVYDVRADWICPDFGQNLAIRKPQRAAQG